MNKAKRERLNALECKMDCRNNHIGRFTVEIRWDKPLYYILRCAHCDTRIKGTNDEDELCQKLKALLLAAKENDTY